MGFMDKAKKLAEQAQEKLDEAQEGFNQTASPAPEAPGQRAVSYDEHGRPIERDAAAGASDDEQGEAPQVTPQPPSETGGANANPDPFRPLQQ